MNSLLQCPLFKDMSQQELHSLLEKYRFPRDTYPKNAVILQENSKDRNLYVVLEGTVSVHKLFFDGRLLKLNEISRGNMFGISNLFSPEISFPSIVTAVSPSTLLSISEGSLMEIFTAYPAILHNYLCFCNNRILYLNEKIALFNLSSAREKLLHFLSGESKKSPDAGRIRLSFSKEALAHFLGISRASLYRELKKLESEALISIQSKTILLHSPESLRHPDLWNEKSLG